MFQGAGRDADAILVNLKNNKTKDLLRSKLKQLKPKAHRTISKNTQGWSKQTKNMIKYTKEVMRKLETP